jgi:hypothetical protein
VDAPCDPSQSNVYTVPNPGYEDKVVITDYGCNPPGGNRTNTQWEAQYGCWVYDNYFYSDLPAAYQDTVILDDTINFTPASGSADPGSIQEGDSYFWYYEFFQFGLEQHSSLHHLKHNVGVTTKVPFIPNCPQWCFFSVEQTKIAPDAQF